MKSCSLIIACMLLVCQAAAQSIQEKSIRESIASSKANKETTLVKPPTTSDMSNNQEEYVYYRNLIRKYSWLEGQGDPISKEVASHLPYYFRLSMKNSAGHFQYIEAMHGDTLTRNHPLTPYILDKANDDSQENAEWRNKVSRVGQWMLSSDATGKILIEERAYEAVADSANLMYVMQPLMNDPNHTMICYLDDWGLPAEMHENPKNVYGSLVYITFDSMGRDSIIDYLDGMGLRKTNGNGVDQQRCIYDEKDRIVLETSNNAVGDYATDNWGNCGNRYEYREDGSFSMTRVDRYLNPMRMPQKRASVENTFIRCDISFDKWGRMEETVMKDSEGNPDETLGGIHKILYTYLDDGTLVEKKYYNMMGEEL